MRSRPAFATPGTAPDDCWAVARDRNRGNPLAGAGEGSCRLPPLTGRGPRGLVSRWRWLSAMLSDGWRVPGSRVRGGAGVGLSMRPAHHTPAGGTVDAAPGGRVARRAHARGPSNLPIKAPCLWSSAGSGARRPPTSRGLTFIGRRKPGPGRATGRAVICLCKRATVHAGESSTRALVRSHSGVMLTVEGIRPHRGLADHERERLVLAWGVQRLRLGRPRVAERKRQRFPAACAIALCATVARRSRTARRRSACRP
jgi:hypothetical protein